MGGYTYETIVFIKFLPLLIALSSNDLFHYLGDPHCQTFLMIYRHGRCFPYLTNGIHFHDRLLLNASLRYDGSLKWLQGNRWQAYPIILVAWRLNNEAWFHSLFPDLTNLTLRVPGSTG
jgi:hypothetical protein